MLWLTVTAKLETRASNWAKSSGLAVMMLFSTIPMRMLAVFLRVAAHPCLNRSALAVKVEGQIVGDDKVVQAVAIRFELFPEQMVCARSSIMFV